MLDDPVTAQYTHTLTMTGRHGGEYKCIVSNNKPSEHMANLAVQGICTHTHTTSEMLASLTVQCTGSDVTFWLDVLAIFYYVCRT